MKVLENVKDNEIAIYKELQRLAKLDRRTIKEKKIISLDGVKYDVDVSKEMKYFQNGREIVTSYKVVTYENDKIQNIMFERKVKDDVWNKNKTKEEFQVIVNGKIARKVIITYENSQIKDIDIKYFEEEEVKDLERFYDPDKQTFTEIKYNGNIYKNDKSEYSTTDSEGCLFVYDINTNQLKVYGREYNSDYEKNILNYIVAFGRLDAIKTSCGNVLELASDLGVNVKEEINSCLEKLEKRKKELEKVREDILVVPKFFQALGGLDGYSDNELAILKKILSDYIDKNLEEIVEAKIGNVLDKLDEEEWQYVLKKKFSKE